MTHVSGHDGGERSTILLAYALLPALIHVRNVLVPWLCPHMLWSQQRMPTRWFVCPRYTVCIVGYSMKYILDFCVIVVPTILAYTIYIDRLPYIIGSACAISLGISIFAVTEYVWLYRDKVPLMQALCTTFYHPRPMHVSYLR